MARLKTATKLTKETPETPAQAKVWENTARKYQDDGLCRPCAGQAAYGHQLGFSRVQPPCDGCAPVVAGFPLPAGAGTPWRKWPRGTRRP